MQSLKKKSINDLLKVIFGLSIAMVLVAATLFVAISSQYIFIDRDKVSPTIEILRNSSPSRPQPAQTISQIVNRNFSRFQSTNIELSALIDLYNEIKDNENADETINDLISAACEQKFTNEENIAKCEQILSITIENIKEKVETGQPSDPKTFLIELMEDLVAAGVIPPNVLQDLITIKTDLQAFNEALQEYLADQNEQSKQALIDATKTLIQDVSYLIQTYFDQEQALKTICEQTRSSDICTELLSDIYTAVKQYQAGELEEGDFIQYLKEDFNNLGLEKFAEINKYFLVINTAFLNTLKAQSSILENIINPNTGSQILNNDATELENNLAAYQTNYQTLSALLNQLIFNGEAPSFNSAIQNYIASLFQIVKNYPKYTFHTDITAHYLNANLHRKSIDNQLLYGSDIDGFTTLAEKYKGIDGSAIHALINGNQGLISLLNTIIEPLNLLENQWLELFTIIDQKNLKTAYENVRKQQTETDQKILEIRNLELQVVKEICNTINTDNFSVCTYNYGAVLKSLSEGNSIKDAICTQAPDPTQCASTWDTFATAIEETRNSEDPTLKTLIDNLAQNLLNQSQYQELAALISQTISDKVLTREEIKTIAEEIIQILYENGHFEEQAQKLFETICRNTTNFAECVEIVEDIVDLTKQLYNGDITVQEALTQLYQDVLANLTSGDPEAISTTMENIEDAIQVTLILNEGARILLVNRDMEELTSDLEADYEFISAQFSRLKELKAEIFEVLQDLEEVDNRNEERELTLRFQALMTEYLTILLRLEAYYLNNYTSNIYAASYLIIDFNFDKQLKRTDLNNNHALDIINIVAATHPELSWSKILTDINEIIQTTADNLSYLNAVIPLLADIATSNQGIEHAKDAQKVLNEGMKLLIEQKSQLLIDLSKIHQDLKEIYKNN